MERYAVYAIVIFVFVIRLAFLKISKKNEKNILENGGSEYGVQNSKRITILHIIFYFGSLIEAIVNHTVFDKVSFVGLCLLTFSMIMLYTVVRLLDGIWTVKLMVAKNHKFKDHWLFRTVKHPNYFLNIVPELAGIGLICHSKVVSIFVLPLYAIVLYIRIKEENMVLKTIIKPNGSYT